jgi:hypothetical protein
MKFIFIIIIIFIINNISVFASEKDLIDLAESHNRQGEYYNAITEVMRYQYIYRKGTLFPKSMLILSESYYRGGNFDQTIKTLGKCHEKFKNLPEGERALYDIGYVRLVQGSAYFAFRTFKEYEYIYKDGIYKEDIARDMCYTLALLKDLKGAKKAIVDYEINYSEGKYQKEINDFQILVDNEINRPKKSLLVSVLGSIVIPGFGHFYAGKFGTGVFSLVSNAALSYLFYRGYKEKDKVQMIVFGFAEFTFYQYSLYSSIRNVYEYNNNEQFYKSIRLSAVKEF